MSSLKLSLICPGYIPPKNDRLLPHETFPLPGFTEVFSRLKSLSFPYPRSHPPFPFTQTSRILISISFLFFSPRTSPASRLAASANTLFLTFYCINPALIISLKVIALWIMDQVPLGHKAPRQGMARLIHCPACRGMLTSPLTLNSSHVLLECMAVEGTQPGVLCPVIYLFIQELE